MHSRLPPPRPGPFAALAIALGLAVIPAAIAPAPAASAQERSAQAARFTLCGSGARIDCVVDGDTIWMAGRKVRMADYNTPETSRPACPRERALGQRATARLLTLLNEGPVTLHRTGPRDTDRFGRLLREVRTGGRSVGEPLMAEGLAHAWRGRREGWC